MQTSFFTQDGEWFLPTDICRGPWDPDACHAGPPTGLLARAAELAVSDQRLVRLTVELLRPIPHAGFRIRSQVIKAGRTASLVGSSLEDQSGRTACESRALLMAGGAPHSTPTTAAEAPDFQSATPGPFFLGAARHGLAHFAQGVELRYPPGQSSAPGPSTVWMRAPALLPDEAPSPFQSVCPLADCGNALSRNGDIDAWAFMNVDLTIHLHRPPQGEWIAASAVSRWEADGVGLSDTLLFDHQGLVGRATQTLLVQPRA